MTNNTFFLIFRNSFLKCLVRNFVFQNSIIKVCCLDHLKIDSKYLSLFSTKNKLEYNIFTKLAINNTNEFNQYLTHCHKDLINYLEIKNDVNVSSSSSSKEQPTLLSFTKTSSPFTSKFDCNLIPPCINRLSFYVNSGTEGNGNLPDSVRYLEINTIQGKLYSEFLEQLISSLSNNVHTLALPSSFRPETKCSLPKSLTDLQYSTNYFNYDNLVITPPLTAEKFKNCSLQIHNKDGIEWIQKNKWIKTIVVSLFTFNYTDFPPHQIPDHVTHMCISFDVKIQVGCLPNFLEKLCACRGEVQISPGALHWVPIKKNWVRINFQYLVKY